MRNLVVVLLLVLSGCAAYQPPPSPVVWVREIPPPVIRYRIKYQRRGTQVVRDFAGIELEGQYMVVPTP